MRLKRHVSETPVCRICGKESNDMIVFDASVYGKKGCSHICRKCYWKQCKMRRRYTHYTIDQLKKLRQAIRRRYEDNWSDFVNKKPSAIKREDRLEEHSKFITKYICRILKVPHTDGELKKWEKKNPIKKEVKENRQERQPSPYCFYEAMKRAA